MVAHILLTEAGLPRGCSPLSHTTAEYSQQAENYQHKTTTKNKSQLHRLPLKK